MPAQPLNPTNTHQSPTTDTDTDTDTDTGTTATDATGTGPADIEPADIEPADIEPAVTIDTPGISGQTSATSGHAAAEVVLAPVVRPARLLTQNGEMREIGVWNWTLPAWAGRLPDGRSYNTCPSAGVCAQACYARHGKYLWPVVRAKHHANLAFVLDDLSGWQAAMAAELAAPRLRGGWVRIHDAGDFFSDAYLTAWLQICRDRPEVNFYAYTKEVDRFRRLVEPDPPDNFWWVYSYGGTQDGALDPDTDRIADVFPDEPAITHAGWTSNEATDLLAVLGPRLVGVPANRIPAFLKRLRGRRFSEWQAEVDAERDTRHQRRRHRDCGDRRATRALAGPRSRTDRSTRPVRRARRADRDDQPTG